MTTGLKSKQRIRLEDRIFRLLAGSTFTAIGLLVFLEGVELAPYAKGFSHIIQFLGILLVISGVSFTRPGKK